MHWEVLIVPLIALGVWILGTLFRTEEDERAKQRRRGTFEGGARVPPRRPVTDLDRFLEEARRRRETAEKGLGSSPPIIERPPRVGRPLLPQERPPREVPRRPRPAPSGPPRQPVVEIPVTVPVARPVLSPPSEAVPPPAVVVATAVRVEAIPAPVAAVAAPEEPSQVTPSPARGPAMSPILTQVAALLRSPQTAGAALVLREIFDQPLCRRHRPQ